MCISFFLGRRERVLNFFGELRNGVGVGLRFVVLFHFERHDGKVEQGDGRKLLVALIGIGRLIALQLVVDKFCGAAEHLFLVALHSDRVRLAADEEIDDEFVGIGIHGSKNDEKDSGILDVEQCDALVDFVDNGVDALPCGLHVAARHLYHSRDFETVKLTAQCGKVFVFLGDDAVALFHLGRKPFVLASQFAAVQDKLPHAGFKMAQRLFLFLGHKDLRVGENGL